jgi:hypothetical protein
MRKGKKTLVVKLEMKRPLKRPRREDDITNWEMSAERNTSRAFALLLTSDVMREYFPENNKNSKSHYNICPYPSTRHTKKIIFEIS